MKNLLTWLLTAAVMTFLVIHETGALEERFGPSNPPGSRLILKTPPSGESVPLKMVDLPIIQWGSGRLEAARATEVSTEIYGRILEVNAKLGERVDKGDVMVRIDPAAAQNSLEEAHAAVTFASSQVLAARGLIKVVSASRMAAENQLEHARLEQDRQETLMLKKATTDQALLAAQVQRKAAEAGLAQVEAQAIQAEAQLQSASTGVLSAKVREADAQRILVQCDVRSPLDGFIEARYVEVGSIASVGMPLVSLRPWAELEAVAWFAEDQLPTLGQLLLVRINGLALGRAPVTRLGTTVDLLTSKRAVKVDLTDFARELTQSTVGSFCELGRPDGTRSVLLVPAQAVRREGQIESVRLVAQRGTVVQHVRTVPLGKDQAKQLDLLPSEWREVRSGLRPDDQVEVPR